MPGSAVAPCSILDVRYPLCCFRAPAHLESCSHGWFSSDPTCTSKLVQYRAAVECAIARNADNWYLAAMLVAVTINLIIFFGGKVDFSSSLACDGHTCTDRSFFHWLTTSWGTSGVRTSFGLRLTGRLALGTRILVCVLYQLYAHVLTYFPCLPFLAGGDPRPPLTPYACRLARGSRPCVPRLNEIGKRFSLPINSRRLTVPHTGRV